MAESTNQLKSVTIETQEDGTYLVGKDTEAPMMAEEGAEEMAQDAGQGMQPAATIDDALDLARQMLQEGGMTDEESVMAGYASAKPKGLNKPSPAKIFGEV